MKDLYLNHEERFGPLLSNLYAMITKIGPMKGFYDFILEDLEGSRFTSILDVGTGPGIIPIRLSGMRRARIYAVDPSRDMIAIAKRKAGSATKIKFALGSSRHVPFNIKFDMIISTLSFHHWARKKESLQYLKSLLAKGGQIRIYERQRGSGLMFPGFSSHLLDIDEAISAVKSSGLKIVRVAKKNGFVCLTIKPAAGKHL
ncbi:MAG: methyltransferase domain-containing protein [Candidatus Marsarchaeota archaeon]|nr:methyltransferase domain-containing protein [Candidatus Marsarchaeota archaeon]